MNTRTDETAPTHSYELRCVDCPFETTVEGDVFEVLDAADSHREEHAADGFRHFVEFESEEAE